MYPETRNFTECYLRNLLWEPTDGGDSWSEEDLMENEMYSDRRRPGFVQYDAAQAANGGNFRVRTYEMCNVTCLTGFEFRAVA